MESNISEGQIKFQIKIQIRNLKTFYGGSTYERKYCSQRKPIIKE